MIHALVTVCACSSSLSPPGVRQGAAARAHPIDDLRLRANARAASRRQDDGHGARDGGGRHAGAERHHRPVHDVPRTHRPGGSADAQRSRRHDILRRQRVRAWRAVQAPSGGGTGGERRHQRVEITVGAAAVNTVTLRANPGSVSRRAGRSSSLRRLWARPGRPSRASLSRSIPIRGR